MALLYVWVVRIAPTLIGSISTTSLLSYVYPRVKNAAPMLFFLVRTAPVPTPLSRHLLNWFRKVDMNDHP